MSCEEIKKLLDEYITGELEESLQEKIREHIEGCPGCKREYEDLKNFKSELKSLSEEVPQGFDEKLKDKIRKEKKTAFRWTNHFGAGMAAAVVLVCLIGLGYGMGHGTIVEDKINSVKNSTAQSAGIDESFDEGVEQAEETNRENRATEKTEQAEETDRENMVIGETEEAEKNTSIPTENTTIYYYMEETETRTEAKTYGKTEINSPAEAETLPEINTVETKIAPITEAVTEITTNSPPALIDRQSVKTIIPEKEAEERAEEVFDDMDIDSGNAYEKSSSGVTTDIDAVAPAAGYGGGDTASDRVTFILKEESLEKVYSLLEETEGISHIERNDGKIYARVNNLPYVELKEMLLEYEAEEKNGAPDENCTEYALVIEAE